MTGTKLQTRTSPENKQWFDALGKHQAARITELLACAICGVAEEGSADKKGVE